MKIHLFPVQHVHNTVSHGEACLWTADGPARDSDRFWMSQKGDALWMEYHMCGRAHTCTVDRISLFFLWNAGVAVWETDRSSLRSWIRVWFAARSKHRPARSNVVWSVTLLVWTDTALMRGPRPICVLVDLPPLSSNW